jgi:type I restriction enzyme, S subunit
MKAGWETKKLGEVLRLEYGKPLDNANRKFDGLYPVYGANGEKNRSDKFYFDKPSIILGRKGSAGELNITEKKFWPLDVTYFVTFEERQHNLQFLYYLLSTLDLSSLAKGVKPGINRNEVYSQRVAIPPLPEQQRIVGILDKAFAGIATAKANAEKNLQNARALFESHLQSVFTQRGEGWVEKRLGDECVVKDGTHDSPKYVTYGIPFVTQKNIRKDGLSFADTKFITQNDHDNFYRRSNVAHGDILISMIGANRGMACIVDDERIFSIKNVGLVKQNVNVNQLFLLYFLKSPQAANYVRSGSKGGAQEFIGLTELRNFPIHFPPLSRQNALADEFETLSTETQRLESIYQSKLTALDELKKSLLHQAFSGKL